MLVAALVAIPHSPFISTAIYFNHLSITFIFNCLFSHISQHIVFRCYSWLNVWAFVYSNCNFCFSTWASQQSLHIPPATPGLLEYLLCRHTGLLTVVLSYSILFNYYCANHNVWAAFKLRWSSFVAILHMLGSLILNAKNALFLLYNWLYILRVEL